MTNNKENRTAIALVADKAKEELAELMDELFMAKIQSSMDGFVQTTGKAQQDMSNKLDIQSSELGQIQNEIGKIATSLPEHLKPLGMLQEIKTIQLHMGDALLKRLQGTEDSLKQKIEEHLAHTTGFVNGQHDKLIKAVIEYHREALANASGIIQESFGQMAASLQTSADHISGESDRNQLEMLQLIEGIRSEITTQISTFSQELDSRQADVRSSIQGVFKEMEQNHKRRNLIWLILLSVQSLITLFVAYSVIAN